MSNWRPKLKMIKIVNSKSSASEACTALLVEFKKYHYIRVKIERETRTLKQNAWIYQAYAMLEAQGDMTTSEYRNYCKYHFGLSIRAASDPDFAVLLKPMLKALIYEDRLKSMMFVEITSTFDVGQMTSYINEIINHFPNKLLPDENWR